MTPRNSNEEITPKKMFLLHIRYNFSILAYRQLYHLEPTMYI